MLEQFAIVKRYNCITAEAVLLADICIKQRIFYFTLYREVTNLVSRFFTQDTEMKIVSAVFVRWAILLISLRYGM